MSKVNLISTGQSAITLPRGREVPAVAGTPFQLDSMADAEWLVRAGAAEIVAAPRADGPKPQHTINELRDLLATLDDAAAVQELLDAELALAEPRATAVKLLEAKLRQLAAGDQGGDDGNGPDGDGTTAPDTGTTPDGAATPDGDDGTGAIGPDDAAAPAPDDGTGAIGPDDAAAPAPDDDGVTANAPTAPAGDAGDDTTNPDSTTNE